MRGTLHVLTAEDLPLYCAGQRTRDQSMNPSFLRYMGLEMADMEALLDAIPQALDGKELTRAELADEVVKITGRTHLSEHLRSGWGSCLKPAAFRGLLCFATQAGRHITFARPDQWIGGWKEWETQDALREVFRRFLSAYGPADRAELARWWGVRPPEAGRILRLLDDEVTEVTVEGKRRWILVKDLRSLQRAGPVSGVRLLPSFDELLVMSAPHKHAIVDGEFASRIYTPKPIAVWSLPAVLVDGRARGAWKLERKPKRVVVRVEPFKRLSPAHRKGLEAEVATVGACLGAEAHLDLRDPT